MTRYDASNPRHEATPTARFWTFHRDGWVKLSIRPGASLTALTGGRHDEGFSYTAETFENTGCGVAYQWATWGLDCDGRHESGGGAYCPIPDLTATPADTFGPARPDWQQTRRHQRDHAAEAAGY
jgi:hypothetical protein